MGVPELKPIEGKYEILGKLNEGGMGAVYKVQHRLLEEIRVIKVIRPQLQADENLKRRFLREARAAVRLRHPNIAQLYDFTVADDGTAYMVIEFIDGIDLVHLIQKSSLPDLSLVLDIAIQALRALAYLHRKQFVHRDISPDNLMLTKDVEGRALVKLIDLGIAKPMQSEMNLTGEGFFLGKVRYASPEQFGGQSGKEEIDQRSDLYSFGIVLYELLTGLHPITGEDNQSVLAGHLFHPPRQFAETDPQDHVPEGLRRIVMKALEKIADDRYPDADTFSNELAAFGAQWTAADSAPASIDATVIRPRPQSQTGRPGSTQDRLDLEFAPQPTPPPRPLEAVSPPFEDNKEALLQTCCDKVESLLSSKRLMEAEVELRRSEKTLGSSILLDDLSNRIQELRDKVNEAVVRARLLQRDGDLEAARDQISVANELDAENPEASSLLKEISESLEQRAREIELTRNAIEVQLETGQLEEALKRLTEAQEQFGHTADFENLQERVASLMEAADHVRRIAEAAGQIGQMIEQGKLHQADSALIAAIRTHGDDEMFTELADQISSLEKREKEREELAREAERRQQVKSYLEVAQQQYDAESYEVALEQIEQAARLDPDNPQVKAFERRAQESLERRDLRHRRERQLEELTSEFESRLDEGDLDGAEDLLTAAEADHGQLHELASLRVRIDEIRLERREKAVGELLKKAFRFFEAGNLDEATANVDQALTLSPGLPQATKLQQKIVERRREERSHRALEVARSTILGHLDSGALDQAAKALEAAIEEQGPVRELEDLERRLQETKAREGRRLEIRKAGKQIEKLIAKSRLDKASAALASAVREHGQDPVFEKLKTRIEDVVGRERTAKEILAAEAGKKPATIRSRPVLIVAAALLVLVVAMVVFSIRPSSVTKSGVDPTAQVEPEEPVESLDTLLEGRDIGDFFALVVGNNSYQMGLPNLETAVNDAEKLAAILESRYGFQTELLLDATRYETLSALDRYVKRLDSGDNLLVFYAGHGFVDNITGRGYWQPTDAEPDNTANWISSLEVSDLLLDIPAQRVLVVADSCFSGAFADNGETSAKPPEMPTGEEILERLASRTRWVLSSGSLQPVLDNGVDGHSVFSRALLTVLEESQGAIELTQLFERVRQTVSLATVGMELQQQPQFAPLDSDDGGVFLFVASR